jgi:hypothetical protein
MLYKPHGVRALGLWPADNSLENVQHAALLLILTEWLLLIELLHIRSKARTMLRGNYSESQS